jgi:hypothetical protein
MPGSHPRAAKQQQVPIMASRTFQFQRARTVAQPEPRHRDRVPHPDLTGVARGKILPRQKFTEDRGMRLPRPSSAWA